MPDAMTQHQTPPVSAERLREIVRWAEIRTSPNDHYKLEKAITDALSLLAWALGPEPECTRLVRDANWTDCGPGGQGETGEIVHLWPKCPITVHRTHRAGLLRIVKED